MCDRGCWREYRHTHMYVTQIIYTITTAMTAAMTMGWLQSVGSIKLQVSFAEYCLFYRALLQKRPIIVSILLTKATPYCHRTSSRQGDLSVLQCVAVWCCVALCCRVLRCVALCCSALQCVAVCCSVLQCVAVCCSVLQRVAVHNYHHTSSRHRDLGVCDRGRWRE